MPPKLDPIQEDDQVAGAGAVGGAGAAGAVGGAGAGNVGAGGNVGTVPRGGRQAADAAAAAGGVGQTSGSQVNSIEKYDGEEGFRAESWCGIIDRCQVQFAWNELTTAANAKQRLTGPALIWLTAQEKMGPALDTWTDLRAAIIRRFYPTVSDLAAAGAVTDLKMRPDETPGMYYDRVILAVDKLFHRQPVRNVNTMRTFRSIVFSLFAAGLPPDVRTLALGSDKPPETPEALLNATIAIDSQNKRKGMIVAEVSADSGADSLTTDGTTNVDSTQEIVEAVVAALKARNVKPKFTGKCFYCDREGHYARDCFKKQRDEGRGGEDRGQRGRGGRGRGGHRGRGGRRNYEVQDGSSQQQDSDASGTWTFTPYKQEE